MDWIGLDRQVLVAPVLDGLGWSTGPGRRFFHLSLTRRLPRPDTSLEADKLASLPVPAHRPVRTLG